MNFSEEQLQSLIKEFAEVELSKSEQTLSQHSFESAMRTLFDKDIWFGVILSELVIRFETKFQNHEVKTAAVVMDNEKALPVLYINPYFLAWVHLGCGSPILPPLVSEAIDLYKANQASSMPKRIGLLKHEILHLVLRHHARLAKLSDMKKAQLAADIEVNNYLQPEELPSGAVFCSQFGFPEGQTFEWYYERINSVASLGGGMDVVSSKGLGGDKKETVVADPGEDLFPSEGLENVAQSFVEKANQLTNRVRGTMPAKLIEELGKINISSKLNWKSLLQHYVSSMYTQEMDNSFRRPHRRIPGLYPSIRRVPRPKVTIAIDTSGSVDKDLFEAFLAEVERIMEFFPGVTLLQADASVQEIKEIEPGEVQRRFKRRGFGGTSFQPVIDWCRKRGIFQIVYLTDGIAPAPESEGVRVVWALPADVRHEHLSGQKIFLEKIFD